VGQTWTLPFAEGATASGFSLDDLTVALLIGSAVLVVAVAAVRLSLRSGLPSLLIYLGIGLVLGESGFGIQYENQQQTQVLGYAALVLILVEGGITTRWSGIRRSVAPAAVLATVGVGVSVLVVGVAAHVFLGWDWQIAFLVAAVLASTDAAAVFSVLRRCRSPGRSPGCSRPSRASTTLPSCSWSPPSPPA
jgi:cell volume regulation protein A